MAESVEAYAQKYLDINWKWGKEQYHGSVDHYLCMDKTKCDRAKVDGAQAEYKWMREDAAKMKVSMLGDTFVADDPDGNPLHVSTKNLDRAFKGKGTPTDLLLTAQLATHLGHVTNNMAKENDRCKSPKYFTHAYLGMDCNGFAMNFLGKDPNTPIDKLDDQSKSLRRKELDDIQAGDVLIVGADYHHIAIVSSVGPKQNDTRMVYTFESLGKDFTKPKVLIGVCSQHRLMKKKSPGVFLEIQGGKIPDTEFYFQPVADRGSPNW